MPVPDGQVLLASVGEDERAVTFAAWAAGSEQDRAADKLRHWGGGSRDDAVREAAAAGLSLMSIQEITGLGKTTIMRILNDRLRRGARS